MLLLFFDKLQTRKSAMFWATDDLRIEALKPLIPPAILMEELPLTDAASETVSKTRRETTACIHGKDDRLVVIAGPCSIHDPDAAKEYAQKLKEQANRFSDELLIIMRVYFEKPRTSIGWKGLINDPFIDGTFQINKGLHIARELLVHLAEIGLPAGCEFLDTIMPQFIADLVSLGAIGARTTETRHTRRQEDGGRWRFGQWKRVGDRCSRRCRPTGNPDCSTASSTGTAIRRSGYGSRCYG